MLLTRHLRRLVSGQKRRFQDGPDGFDLDLAYISPRVIAMGLPAQGKEGLYRNPMPEIARFLQTYHRGHAKVYNLCSEHTYNPQHLSVVLQHFPYDDHQAPPLAMVQQFCADAAAWLAADPANVVVVHCKAGKGRTGIMICCLLLYLHKNAPDLANLASSPAPTGVADVQQSGIAWLPLIEANSAALLGAGQGASCPAGLTGNGSAFVAMPGAAGRQLQQQQLAAGRGWHPWQFVQPVQLTQLEQPVRDVLDLYAERRTHDGNGVTIKSQRRYVGYFWAVLSGGAAPVGLLPQPRAVQLRQVSISGLPPGTADSCELWVEARPSGSMAPRATRVLTRTAPRAVPGAAMAGLCMVPCTTPPLVQDDSCCISAGPLGDSLTFRMPAASLGLSLLPQASCSSTNSSSMIMAAAPVQPLPQVTAVSTAEEQGRAPGPAAEAAAPAATRGVSPATGCFSCLCCKATTAAACSCTADAALPGAVPAAAEAPAASAGAAAAAQAQPVATPAAAACAVRGAAVAGGCGTVPAVAADELVDAVDQAGACVVEGDVRLVVMKGTTRLFYTWFNTAFLPADGCYTLGRAQLDKPLKGLPPGLSVTLRFVDVQPTADEEEAPTAQEAVQQAAHKRQKQQPWARGFKDPPLETTAKAAQGAARQQPGKSSQLPAVNTINMVAEATAGAVRAPGPAAAVSKSGPHEGSLVSASAAAAQQQQQLPRCASADGPSMAALANASATCAVQVIPAAVVSAAVDDPWQPQPLAHVAAGLPSGVTSSSAPASPQSRKLRSSGSWRHNLPAISSISTSALLWCASASSGSAVDKKASVGGGSSKADSPSSWCGTAGLSWDWDSLAAADDVVGLPPATAASLSSGGGADSGGSILADSFVSSNAAGTASVQPQQQQQQQARRQPFGLQSSQRLTQARGMVGLGGTRVVLGTSRNADSSRRGSYASVGVLSDGPASIELPAMVKHTIGVSSLMGGLVCSQHTAAPCGISAAAAAAAAAIAAASATSAVIASEAGSGSAAACNPAIVKPSSQLRKGSSWHGSSSWFGTIPGARGSPPAAAVLGSGPGSKPGVTAAACSTTDGVVTRAGKPCCSPREHAADLDPLLVPEGGAGVQDGVTNSSDSLASLLEALNWSTDVQRYQAWRANSSSSSYSRAAGASRRHSTSSEPCTPRRTGGLLPTVLSSPLLLPSRSAPPTPPPAVQAPPPAAAAAGAAGTLSAGAAALDSCSGARFSTLAGPVCKAGAAAGAAQCGPRVAQRGGDGASGSNGSSVGSRRPRLSKSDVCRLLDLEDWVEEETEGQDDSCDVASAGPSQGCSGAVAAAAAAAAARGKGDRVGAAGSAACAGAAVHRLGGREGSCARTPAKPSPSVAVARPDMSLVRAQSEESDAAAASDTTAPMRACASMPRTALQSGASSRGHTAAAAAAVGSSSSSGLRRTRGPSRPGLGRAAAVGDDALQGLLADEGVPLSSCMAAAPTTLQQWQQLESAWQKRWWV